MALASMSIQTSMTFRCNNTNTSAFRTSVHLALQSPSLVVVTLTMQSLFIFEENKVKSPTAELCLDRGVVLELLCDPPPKSSTYECCFA